MNTKKQVTIKKMQQLGWKYDEKRNAFTKKSGKIDLIVNFKDAKYVI